MPPPLPEGAGGDGQVQELRRDLFPFRRKLRKMLRDGIGMADEEDHYEWLRAKARLEAKVGALIASHSSSKAKNCARLLKRLRRGRGMLFTFLEQDGGRLEQQRD